MASRFWVGGTGTWDASSTTHWAATSGGASGASVPGASDTVTFDANSGGGTVTVATDVTVQSISCGAFTGTLDWSVNNNNVTLSAGSGAFNGSGTGVRTIKLGSGTWNFTSTATIGAILWNMGTTTNLTFDGGSATLRFSGDAVPSAGNGQRVFSGGGLTYGTVQIDGQTKNASFNLSGVNTIGTLSISGRNNITLSSNQTITNLTLNGTSSGLILIQSTGVGSQRTLSVASNAPTMSWCAFSDIVGAGGASFVANNSFDMGNNSGITFNAPSTGGGHIASRQQLGM